MNCHFNRSQQSKKCYAYNSCGTHFILQKPKTLKLHLTYEEILFKNNKSTGRVGGLDSQFVIK